MKGEFPNLEELYVKSDDASSYHGEALYQLCCERQIKLRRYNYSEPSHGKDQCDRESAGARCVLRSYVDTWYDLLTSEDIYHALHYDNGIQNAEILVVAIDNNNSMLSSETTIPKICQYHSFEFHSDHMVMWRYFGNGFKKGWNYAGVKFQPAIQIVLPFSATSKHKYISSKSKQPRLDRSNNTLKFCPEIGCSKTFEDDASLEEQLLSEQHNPLITKSMVDRAKHSYITRMNSSFLKSSLQLSTSSILLILMVKVVHFH